MVRLADPRRTSIASRAVALAIMVLSASYGPASALDAGDTLAAWKGASAGEKAKLVTQLLNRDGRASGTRGVVKCLDEASGIPGHARLTISQVVAACEKEQGDPV